MRYAVIAAGEGSRLRQEGVAEPKPLVKIGGECLIDRLLRVFMQNGAEEIWVVCNDRWPAVGRHLQRMQHEGLGGRSIPLNYMVKNTPSSMHSFYELSSHLQGGPFILTTVDTIFREKEFADYVNCFRQRLREGFDGVMGVTNYIDDEKPLYVATDAYSNITGFYDAYKKGIEYISGGIYGLKGTSLDTLNGCMARGESRMRNFQRALIADGRRLKAYAFSKVLDIDHKEDIAKAETFLSIK